MNKKVSFLVSLIISVACVIIIMRYVSQERLRVAAEYEMVPALRATQDIPKLSVLEDHMVEVVSVPKKYLQPSSLKEKLDIRGKITDAPILKGEMITKTKVVLPSRKTGLSFQLEEGKRAITIAVSDVNGVGGLIRPFDHVDIMLITSHGDAERQDKRINVLYQDVLVLATGDNLGAGVPSATEKDEITDAIKFVDPEGRRYANITLSVTPKQAMGLVLAQDFGTLNFSLRPAYRSKNANVPSMNIEDVTGYKKPVVQQPRPAWMTLRNSSINF